MDKHKILKKARVSKKDERKMENEVKSYQFSWIGVIIIVSILMLFRFNRGESVTDLTLIVLTQVTFRFFYQFLKEKDTPSLKSIIISCMLIILLLTFNLFRDCSLVSCELQCVQILSILLYSPLYKFNNFRNSLIS